MLRQAISAMLRGSDSDTYAEEFVTAFNHECQSDDEPFRKKGRYMLDAIMKNDLDAFVTAATGWNARSLLMKAMLLKDDEGFNEDLIDGEISIEQENGNSEWFPCVIDPKTHKVTCDELHRDMLRLGDTLKVSFINSYGQPCEFNCYTNAVFNDAAYFIELPLKGAAR